MAAERPLEGDQRVRQTGLKDVARLAGVAVGTVSNVLNHPDKVSAETAERVNAAIAELGWVRNDAARQLRQGRNGMLGLVVLDVANPFFTDVAAGVEHVATTHGRVVLLTNSGEDADREARALRMFESQRLEGLLVAPVGDDVALLEAVRARGTRVVLIDRLASTPGFSSVAVDDRLGGRLAVEHLLAAGHTRVAFVGASTDIEQVANRLAGAQAAVDAHDGAALATYEASAMNSKAGLEVGEQLAAIDAASRPTAIFAANDLLALGLLQAFLRAGLHVPADVALVGYDDIDYASSAAVPLSSVRQPAFEMGRRAAELLLAEVDGTSTENEQVVFEPELVVRESTAG
jgi:LacI family transcriptional regulator